MVGGFHCSCIAGLEDGGDLVASIWGGGGVDISANGLQGWVEGWLGCKGISLCICIVRKIPGPTCRVGGMTPASMFWGVGLDIPGPSFTMGV